VRGSRPFVIRACIVPNVPFLIDPLGEIIVGRVQLTSSLDGKERRGLLRTISALVESWNIIRDVVGGAAVLSSILSAGKSVFWVALFESVPVVHLVVVAREPDIS